MVLLQNNRLSLRMFPYGARIASLRLSDGTETVLGFPQGGGYVGDTQHLGAVCGRYANRLRPFVVEGKTHKPITNEGENCLHGGPGGFGLRDWEVVHSDETEAVLRIVSADGDQGFPGELTTELRVLLNGSELIFRFEAETTKTTPVNLTLHPYFRLSGDTIRDHELVCSTGGVLATDAAQIPTGDVVAPTGDALDLNTGGLLSTRIAARPSGLDHCYVTPGGCDVKLAHAASGRQLRVTSDAPMVQVYTGSALAAPHGPFAGVAIEPQSAPDGPNRPEFGNVMLRPDERYRREIRYILG